MIYRYVDKYCHAWNCAHVWMIGNYMCVLLFTHIYECLYKLNGFIAMASRHSKSPQILLLVQQFDQANNEKEKKTRARITGILWWESISDRWLLFTTTNDVQSVTMSSRLQIKNDSVTKCCIGVKNVKCQISNCILYSKAMKWLDHISDWTDLCFVGIWRGKNMISIKLYMVNQN